MSEYVAAARKISPFELGRRKTLALHYEPLLEGYFPNEVIPILKSKILDSKIHRYNKADDLFFKENFGRGVNWLASRFYTDNDGIWDRAKTIGVKIERQMHVYTEQDDEFIKANASKGIKWISDKLDLSYEAVRKRGKRLGVEFVSQGAKPYSPHEDELIKNYAYKGKKWLSEELGRSMSSIRHRARRLRVKLATEEVEAVTINLELSGNFWKKKEGK